MGIEPDDMCLKRVISVLNVIRFVGEGGYLGRCIWFWITTLVLTSTEGPRSSMYFVGGTASQMNSP